MRVGAWEWRRKEGRAAWKGGHRVKDYGGWMIGCGLQRRSLRDSGFRNWQTRHSPRSPPSVGLRKGALQRDLQCAILRGVWCYRAVECAALTRRGGLQGGVRVSGFKGVGEKWGLPGLGAGRQVTSPAIDRCRMVEYPVRGATGPELWSWQAIHSRRRIYEISQELTNV